MTTIYPTTEIDASNPMKVRWSTLPGVFFATGTVWVLFLNFFFTNFTVINGGQLVGLAIPKDNMLIYAALLLLQVVFPAWLLLLGYTQCQKRLENPLLDSGEGGLSAGIIKYISRFLHIFPIVQVVLASTRAAKVLQYVKFEEDAVSGIHTIFIESGLSFPTFSEIAMVGQSIAFSLLALLISAFVHISVETHRVGEKPSKKEGLFAALEFLLFFATTLVWFAWNWVKVNFGTISPDQILFHLKAPLKGADSNFVESFVIGCMLPAALVAVLTFLIYFMIRRGKTQLRLQIFSNVKKLSFSSSFWLTLFPAVLLVLSTGYCLYNLGFVKQAQLSLFNAGFIDRNYHDPQEAQLVFPEKKRNLIYIFMESMEATYLSNELGGFMGKNLIPELTELAQNNTSFSNGEQLGGAMPLPYTGWTIAAMVSQQAGIPLKIPIDGNSYGEYQSFLPGAYTLGDILHEQGYNQTLLVGSDAEFGGRKSFYEQHGQFKILDLFTARQDGIIPPDYHVFWGYEDMRLYEYAKKELMELSAKEEPFHLTMLTVDTHHIGGYVCSLCQDQYPTQYWNVQACASRQIQAFIAWLEQQEFYEDTAIVIAGDHPSMDPLVSDMVSDSDYQRTILNIFINTDKEPAQTQNRLFSSMDFFPTTLSAMGVSIPGDRLALGTDLFSNTPTLLEAYGQQTVSDGLYGSSKVFSAMLMGDKQKGQEVSK